MRIPYRALRVTLLLLGALGLGDTALAVNVLPNSGFELEGTGGPNDPAGWDPFSATRSDAFPASGDWAVRLDTTIFGHASIETPIPGGDGFRIVPGSEVTVELDYAWDKQGFSNAGVDLLFFNLANTFVETETLYFFDTGGAYQHARGSFVAPQVSLPGDGIIVRLAITVGDNDLRNNVLWVDNVILDATVPEPATWSLGLVAGLWVMRGRRGPRRQRKGAGPNGASAYGVSRCANSWNDIPERGGTVK